MDQMFNKKMETLSQKKIKENQLNLLKNTVSLVYEQVPFYKKEFKKKGLIPSDIKSLDDIQKLPLTTKNDLRDNMPFGMMCTSLDNCVELHAYSGTTGIPVNACYTGNVPASSWVIFKH